MDSIYSKPLYASVLKTILKQYIFDINQWSPYPIN